MKLRHNKKRNTAFLYEVLIKECTKAIVRKENSKKNKIVSILKEFFSTGKLLKKELDLYNSLLESEGLKEGFSKRFLTEVKKDFDQLDRKAVFNAQTQLIKAINEAVGKEAFANFISNYKSIATVGQYFNSEKTNGAKQRILLEDNVLRLMTSKKPKEKEFKHIDNLTYKTFINKFNETYKHSLRDEQKTLLTCYITSFANNGLDLKVFMNEEIGRLKSLVKENIDQDIYSEKLGKVLDKLDDFKNKPITEGTVKEVFWIQDLLHEVNKNGN